MKKYLPSFKTNKNSSSQIAIKSALIATAITVHSPLSAQTISVNLASDDLATGSEIDTTAGALPAGAVPISGEFWNNAPGASGTLPDLIDSDGNVTTASVSWTSANTWRSAAPVGGTATSQNGVLTKGYLDDGAGWTVDLQTPFLLNDVYVIHATDQGNPATMRSVSVNGIFYKGDGAGSTILASGLGDNWQAANWSDADSLIESDNYLFVANQPTVNIAGPPSGGGRTAVAGIQVTNAYTGTLSYWDANDDNPGGGNLGGTWGTDDFWTADAAGDTTTGAWTAGHAAVFSAGDDSTGFIEVDVDGTQVVDAIWVQNGEVELIGGTLDLSTGSGILRDDADGLFIDSEVLANDLATSGFITFLNPDLTVTGTATFGGLVELTNPYTFNAVNVAGDVIAEGALTLTDLTGAGSLDMGFEDLILGSVNTAVFNGSIIGSGLLQKVNTGTQILGDPSSFDGTIDLVDGSIGFTGGSLFVPIGGSGNLIKQSPSVLSVLDDVNISGDILVNQGSLQIGESSNEGSVVADNLILSDGTTLRFRQLDALTTYSTPVTFGVGSFVTQNAADPAGTTTLTNLTIGSLGSDANGDAVEGTLRSTSGNLAVGTGASVSARQVSLNGGILTIEDGANLTTRYFNIGDGFGNAGIVNQTGGNLTMEEGDFGIRIGHWSGDDRAYNISGGVLDASAMVNNGGTARFINVGWDGTNTSTMTVGGGSSLARVIAPGFIFDRQRTGEGSSAATLEILPNGLVELGNLGTLGTGTNDGVLLSGGSLDVFASANLASRTVLTTATTSDISVASNEFANLTGVVSGDGTLEKTGDGLLIFSNPDNTLSGEISVEAGGLSVVGDSTGTANITITEGARIQTGTPAASGTGTVDTLNLANASSSQFRLGSDLLIVSEPDGITTAGTHFIQPLPSGQLFPGDTFPVIQYSGSISGDGFGAFSLAGSNNPHLNVSLSNNTVDSTIDLTIDSIETITWTGAVDGNWDVDNTGNWELDSDQSSSNFFDFDTVTFADGSANVDITVAGGVVQAGMTFINDTDTLTFSGAGIGGSGGMTLDGTGTVRLFNNNTFAGPIDILAGTLVLGDGVTGALNANAPITLAEDAILDLNLPDPASFSNSIANSGTINVLGAGSLTLLGSVAGTGALNITDGKVVTHNSGGTSLPTEINIIDGTLRFNNSAFGGNRLTGPGIITVEEGSTLEVNTAHGIGGDNAQFTEDLIFNKSQGIFNSEQYANQITLNESTLSGSGEIRPANNFGLTLTGTQPSTISCGINHNWNSGTYTVDNVTGDPATDLLIAGAITSGNSNHTITKEGDGVMSIANAGGFPGLVQINQGTLAIEAGGSLAAISIAIADGASFDVTADGSFTLAGAQTLTGSGTQLGNLVSNGSVAPGTDTGTLTINGNASLNGGSSLVWQVADWTGGTPGTSHDLLVADEIAINATAGSPLLIVVEDDDLVNFSESNASFTIASATGGITGLTADNVTFNTDNFSGGGTWEASEDAGNLIISYTAQTETPYEAFASGFGLVGLAAGPNADPDADGIDNALEFVLGGDPTNLDTSILPTATTDDNNLTFTFRRNAEANSEQIEVEYGSDLVGWTVAEDGVNGITITETIDGFEPGIDRVEVVIPRSLATNDRFFVQLNVTVALTPES